MNEITISAETADRVHEALKVALEAFGSIPRPGDIGMVSAVLAEWEELIDSVMKESSGKTKQF